MGGNSGDWNKGRVALHLCSLLKLLQTIFSCHTMRKSHKNMDEKAAYGLPRSMEFVGDVN